MREDRLAGRCTRTFTPATTSGGCSAPTRHTPGRLTAERAPGPAAQGECGTLNRTTYDQLVQGVDPSELTKAEVYPQIWDSPASLEWAGDLFTPLTGFFRDAASAGHAMLIWID
ncbi:DUF1877 family protein [Streptomyces sp. NPDC002125]